MGGFLSPFTQQFAPEKSNFAHFFEIYTKSPTASNDFGVYQTFVRPPSNLTETPTVTFAVLEFGKTIITTATSIEMCGLEWHDTP